MAEHKAIYGYARPYRIHDDSTIEELVDGNWVKVETFVKIEKTRYRERLCVQLIGSNGKPLVRSVKKLMIDAFFGGSRRGVTYAFRNANPLDCSLKNLHLLV